MSVFYELPASALVEGVSTDDAQRVIDVDHDGGWVSATVYTPRTDDDDADADNRGNPETRIYARDQLVSLAAFGDTGVDLSRHPRAVNRRERSA